MSLSLPSDVSAIPGEPTTIRRHATRFTATADAIRDAVEGLRTAIADGAAHTSLALDQLTDNAGEVATRLGSLENRYREAGSALADFADVLETAQTEASTLVSEAGEAAHSAATAERQIEHYQQQRQTTTDPTEAADLNRHLVVLMQRRTGRQQDLADVQARFDRVTARVQNAGEHAASRMKTAMDGDGWKDNAWDNFSGWVADHADLLTAIHSILQKVTLALSVLSIFIPVLAPFALAAAALTAGLGLVLAATGQISWIDFALDVLAVATMGVAAAASRTIAGVMAALKGTRVARLAAQGASNPLRVVTGSFNGVLRGRVAVKIAGVTIKNAPKWLEKYSAKGITNAHFLRVAQSAKAGAGGPLDDLLLNIGKQEMAKLRTAGLVNVVAGQSVKTATTYLPAAVEHLPETLIDKLPDGVADGVHDFGDWLQDAATWRIGS